MSTTTQDIAAENAHLRRLNIAATREASRQAELAEQWKAEAERWRDARKVDMTAVRQKILDIRQGTIRGISRIDEILNLPELQ